MSTRSDRVKYMRNCLVKHLIEKYPGYDVANIQFYGDELVLPEFGGVVVAKTINDLDIKPGMITRHIPAKTWDFVVPGTGEELRVMSAQDTTYKRIYYWYFER